MKKNHKNFFAKNYFTRLSYFFLVVFLCLPSACSDKKQAKTNEKESQLPAHTKLRNFSEAVNSLPNPLELVDFLANLEQKGKPTSFRGDYLTKSETVRNYRSDYKKALMLGVFRTDLYYANYYKKIRFTLGYINAITTLETEMLASSRILAERIRQIESSLEESRVNLDSIILVHSNFYFEEMQTYFRENNREEMNAWIEFGSWLELAYLAGLYYDDASKDELKMRMAEQKVVLGRLMPVLRYYRGRQGFEKMYEKLEKLWGKFEQIDFEAGQFGKEPLSDFHMADIRNLVNDLRSEAVKP